MNRREKLLLRQQASNEVFDTVLANVEPEGPTVEYPLGSDLAGTSDLDAALNEVSGITALTQAIIRRLYTTSGDYPDYPDYGYDIRELVGTAATKTRLIQIRARVYSQVLAEEEVEAASVRVTYAESTKTLSIRIAARSAEGPFVLTLTSVDGLAFEMVVAV